MTYKLHLDIFEGPLDLLLYLIKKNDLDITQVSLVDVTDQYIEYIDAMQMLNLDAVGEFLVIAATLLNIKSKALLPPDPIEQTEPEEDPTDELVKRLQEYQKFKEIADQLKNMESQRQDLFARTVDQEQMNQIREEAKEVYFEANLFDLINALSKALKDTKDKKVYEVVREEFTVDKKIHHILHILVEHSEVSLTRLFAEANSKLEIICIFLAVLELIRLKEVVALQKRSFDEIMVALNKTNTQAPQESQEIQELQEPREFQESKESLKQVADDPGNQQSSSQSGN